MCGGQRVCVCVLSEGGGGGASEAKLCSLPSRPLLTETAEMWEQKEEDGSAICFAFSRPLSQTC